VARLTKYRTRLAEDKQLILEKEASTNYPDENLIITSPDEAAIIATKCLKIHENPEEHLFMLCMNTKNRIIGVFEISHGTVNSSVVGAREIFQKALLANAVHIILMHNHPSGDPSPSFEDIAITEKLMEAGKIIGVEVLDHLVIGDTYVSIKSRLLA
jgi:DNA repair protein RadC